MHDLSQTSLKNIILDKRKPIEKLINDGAEKKTTSALWKTNFRCRTWCGSSIAEAVIKRRQKPWSKLYFHEKMKPIVETRTEFEEKIPKARVFYNLNTKFMSEKEEE